MLIRRGETRDEKRGADKNARGKTVADPWCAVGRGMLPMVAMSSFSSIDSSVCCNAAVASARWGWQHRALVGIGLGRESVHWH